MSVLFGSASSSWGVRRLLKAIRHEAPAPEPPRHRLGVSDPSMYVFKIVHGSIGRLAMARVLGGRIAEGSDLKTATAITPASARCSRSRAKRPRRSAKGRDGDVVAVAKIDTVKAGEWLSAGKVPPPVDIAYPARNCAIAIEPADRKDDVKLSGALQRLGEEDAALVIEHDDASHEIRLRGVNDEHLNTVLARLKRRFGVEVKSHTPTVGYRESIRKPVTQKGRHKKQSGGHGQFGDVIIEVKPLPRGAGFVFEERIHGGSVPKQWIPAVEDGVREAMVKGPLGFEVVDCAVTLIDGSYHSVDSSELAFRLAGRIAMQEALTAAHPHLLEPMHKLTVVCPSSATSRITSAVAGRRGQMLGLGPRDGWAGWDRIEALIPEAELVRARGRAAFAEPGPGDLRSRSSTIWPSSTDRLPTRSSSRKCPSRPDRRQRLTAPQPRLVEAAMRHWFKDRHFRSLLKNSGYLAVSRVVAAIASVATMALAAHALGVFAARRAHPHHQLRQGGQRDRQVPVVAAGRALRRPGHPRRSGGFQDVDRLRLRASTPSAGSAACWSPSRSCRFSPPGSESGRTSCGWRCSTAPCCRPWARRRRRAYFGRSTGSTSSAGKARSTPIARLVLVTIAYFAHASFAAFVAAWYVTDLAGDLYGWFLGWRELKRRDLLQGIRPTLRPETLPGAWRFAIHVNLNASVQAVWGPIARLVVGGLLGAAGAALFRVASNLADSRRKARRPPRQGLLSRSRADGPVDEEAVEADAPRHRLRQRSCHRCDRGLAARRKADRQLPVRQGISSALRRAADPDGRPVDRRLQLPAAADALRARSARRAGHRAPPGKRGLLPQHRPALVAARSERRGDRLRARQCRHGRRDGGPAPARIPAGAAAEDPPRASLPRSPVPSPAGRARPASSAGFPSDRAARRWAHRTWRSPDRGAFP